MVKFSEKVNENDAIRISNYVIYRIVELAIIENKELFVNKTYLDIRNTECIVVELENHLSITLNIKSEYNKDINKTKESLEKEIISMVELLSSMKVNEFKINII
ncbi:MAG: hypothetical protein RR577_03805 [Erysipelotrichales bacterium]